MATIAVNTPVAVSAAPADTEVHLTRRGIDKVLIALGAVGAVFLLVAGGLLMWGSNFADDYVGKPFSPGELSARIEAVLRRSGETVEAKEVYDDGTVCIDFAARSVTVRGGEVSLTPLEFRLLSVLTEHAGQVLSRQQLIDLVWGRAYESSGDPVKIYIGYLRKKIEEEPASPKLVETVRGFGYRYVKPR